MFKKKVRIASLLVLIWILISATVPAGAQGEGTITGKIVNGSAGGTGTGNGTVTLTVFLNDAVIDTATTNVDATGYYTFSGLETSADYWYDISTDYQGITYYGDYVQFESGTTTLSTDLAVYETEQTEQHISIMSSHIIVFFDADHLNINEYCVFYNSSDRTFYGPADTDFPGETLQFSLPENATNLQVASGFQEGDVQQTDSGFSVNLPVRPGMTEITCSYTTTYDPERFTFLKDIYYPTGGLEFLVGGEAVKINSDQMTRNDDFTVDQETYVHYSATDLQPGDLLTVEITPASSGNGYLILIIMVVIALAFLGAYLMYKQRNRSQEPVFDETDKNTLLKELADLDDGYAAGNIDEDEYQQIRTELKTRIAEIIKSSDAKQD